MTITELRNISGFLVYVGEYYSWFYQYPFAPYQEDIEYITISLN